MSLSSSIKRFSILFSRYAEMLDEKSIVKKDSNHYFDLMNKNNVKILHLNNDEKIKVDNIYSIYKRHITGIYTYQTHELYKSATGQFEASVVPEVFFRNHINYRMNDPVHKRSWADKNFYELYHPEINFPKTILHNIDGRFYDDKYTLLSINEANKILIKYDKFIVKPSLFGGFGKKVTLYQEMPLGGVKDLNKTFGVDYIVQEKFCQHHEMAILNESSVNVVRLMTIFIDEKPEVLMAGVRVGNVGALTDYSPTDLGTGAVILGVKQNGHLRKIGYYPCGKQITSCANGFIFDEHIIPNYSDMVELALSLHKKMPMFRLIAWDMVTDEDGRATVMEYNLNRIGMLYYQWANGPLFGRDEERVHYIIKKLRRE